jgi:hypothetical protein
LEHPYFMSFARLSHPILLLAAALGTSIAPVSAAPLRAVCAPDTAVSQGATAQLVYLAINDDAAHHSVRAFPDGGRSWARSPGIVDPLWLAPGDSVSWIVTVPDSAAPGSVRVPFRVLWESGQDSCVNVITIRAATVLEAPPPGPFRFSLPRVRPNPALVGRPAIATVELPDALPAHLELLDAAGRRTGIAETITGPGRQEVPLTGLARVRPGRYVLRLRHGHDARSRTLIVLP